MVLHYLTYWEGEFARARLVVKSRASKVVVAGATATGLIAVVGAATSITGWAWLGIVSAALAGCVTVLGAWDALFRHRDMWHQRSVVLGRLQALKRTLQVRAASGEDRSELAEQGLAQLNAVLTEDLDSWSEMRRSSQPSPGSQDPEPLSAKWV